MELFGVQNVIDAKPILGDDGIADGFVVSFFEDRKLRNGMVKRVECEKTVWVREYNPLSVKSDGFMHGFGNPTVYKRSSGKRVASKKQKVNLSVIQKIVSR